MMTHHSKQCMRMRTWRLESANDVNIDLFEIDCSLACYMQSLTNKPYNDIGWLV